jgi:membrane fusion protein (multidrug efflux system)
MIDRINYKIGSLIDEGTLLTTISDVKHVYAYFKISEKEYLNFIKNRVKIETNDMNDVELVLADGTKYSETGKIETMESEFEQNTGSISFRAKFANPSKILKHGSTGKIRLSEKIDNAVFVPQQAVFEIQDRYYVYKIDTVNKRAVMQAFTPLRRLTGKYLLKSGLKEGDLIVAEGLLKISNGALLKY